MQPGAWGESAVGVSRGLENEIGKRGEVPFPGRGRKKVKENRGKQSFKQQL